MTEAAVAMFQASGRSPADHMNRRAMNHAPLVRAEERDADPPEAIPPMRLDTGIPGASEGAPDTLTE